MRVLVVTAVDAERDAILAAHPSAASDADLRVIVAGVGPAAAAAGAATALAQDDVDLVVCAGIGGGFSPVGLREVAVASAAVFADLGVETAEHGFVHASELGFGVDRYQVAPALGVQLAERTGGHLGTIVTVATVTGTAASAAALRARYPDVVAEGMEGAGVAAAAAARRLPFAELRAISNEVGPRDRDAWDVPGALAALGAAVTAALT